MRHTEEYGLNLPEGDDIVDVDALNENSMIIDTAMYQIKVRAEEPVEYSEILHRPTSLPASDVFPWAKNPTKPAYSASEIGTYSTDEIDQQHDLMQQDIDDANAKIDAFLPISDAEIDSLFNN